MPSALDLKKIVGKTEEISGESERVKQPDYLGILKNEFFTHPFLGLLEEYLLRCNGSGKSIKNQLRSFKAYHRNTWRVFFILDLLMRAIYLAIIFLVVIRGLGLAEYIIEILAKFT